MILLFITLSSTCQVIQKESSKDSIAFSKEEVNKIASIIFERDYFYSLDSILSAESTLLSLDRDRLSKALLDMRTVVSLKDSIIMDKKLELFNCSMDYDKLYKKDKRKEIVIIGETVLIIGLLIKLL